MNYELIYKDFINNRKNILLELNDKISYEHHHIIPRSFGGNNNAENIIILSTKEHLFAHHLLYKMKSLNSKEHHQMLNALVLFIKFKKNLKLSLNEMVKIREEYILKNSAKYKRWYHNTFKEFYLDFRINNEDFIKNENLIPGRIKRTSKRKLSEIEKIQCKKNALKLWENQVFKEKMLKILKSEKRKINVSLGCKKYYKEHPTIMKERNLIVNKNPEKIKKMAKSHLGMKRSDESKKRMSISAKNRNSFGINNSNFKYFYKTPFRYIFIY